MEKEKAKAKELVEKFTNVISKPYKLSLDKIAAKQCAIIAVDETIDELSAYWLTEQGMDFVDRIKYFEQVKAELNNM